VTSLHLLGADRRLLIGLVALAAAAGGPLQARATQASPSPGERLYLTGVAHGGEGVPAVVQGDLRVSSTEMPCANCHRRSGWAGAEGSITVAPVTGAALFAPVTRGGQEMGTLRTTGPGTRPAYTDATLLRAIREGIDPNGRVLAPAMPRYGLGDADGAALIAHLRSLSATPPPGITGSEVHLATITSPGVKAADRQAMLDVLRAFVRDKNAGTRYETRRRERGPWDMKQHYDTYRSWTLHEWELTGAPAGWPAQLAALYEAQPVFALVGGIVDEDWTPVHEFAERFRVPVILPQTPLPAARAPSEGFYTLYFSRGLALEADTLVERLSQGPFLQVLQLSRCGAPGQAAARRVSERMPERLEVATKCFDGTAPLAEGFWDGIPAGTALALWLDAADAATVIPTLPASLGAVYLSSTLLGADLPRPPAALGDRTMLLQPFVPPGDLERHAWRALAWLKAKGLSGRSPQVAINALYAPLLVAEALTHPKALVSREYFVERIEGMAARSPNRSAYPETVFGPQRRFGSAGCYVLQIPASPDVPYRKVGEWTVPRL
jgi:hypothetical protein